MGVGNDGELERLGRAAAARPEEQDKENSGEVRGERISSSFIALPGPRPAGSAPTSLLGRTQADEQNAVAADEALERAIEATRRCPSAPQVAHDLRPCEAEILPVHANRTSSPRRG